MERVMVGMVFGVLAATGSLPGARAEVIDFSALSPGSSVEGPGVVHPLLTITTSVGNGKALFQGQSPAVYSADTGSSIPNGGMPATGGIGTDRGGFLQDFEFSFAQDVTAFSIRVLDFGDLNGGNATQHTFGIKAFDVSGAQVAMDSFSYTSDNAQNPTSGSAGNLQITGDAILSGGSPPGSTVLSVTGTAIRRVEMFYSHNGGRPVGAPSDPRIGMTDINIEFAPGTVSVEAASFGEVKSSYRD